MYCVNKKKKSKGIDWRDLDDQEKIRSVPEGEREQIRENVRRELLDFQIPRMCDSYCHFPKLIKDHYALEQVCSACPLLKIVRYMEVFDHE